MERQGSLKITNKFAGEAFGKAFGPPNVRTVYAGSEQDNRRRESRVFFLLGASSARKSALIDFMCNYFYGAHLESEQRYRIADEKFDSSTPNLSITTYVFNEAVSSFRPIVIDTPGVGDHKCEKEVHDLFSSWMTHNDKLRIDVVGVVLSAQQRLTTAEETELLKILGYIPQHMRKNIVVLASDSDGSPINISLLRRLKLNECITFKFNDACMFEKYQDDSLKEYLRENYWRMSEKNFTALFEQMKILEPTTLSGMPHDEPHFGSSGSPSLSDISFTSSTVTVTSQKVVKESKREEQNSSVLTDAFNSMNRIQGGKRPVDTAPISSLPMPPPPPPPLPPPPPGLPLRKTPSQSSLSYKVYTDSGETVTKSITFDSTTYGTKTVESSVSYIDDVSGVSETLSPVAPPTPPKEGKEAAHQAFEKSSPTSPTPKPAIAAIPLSDILRYEKENEWVQPLQSSPSTVFDESRAIVPETSNTHESHQSLAGSTKSDIPYYLRSDASDSSRATVIIGAMQTTRTADNETTLAAKQPYDVMGDSSAFSSLSFPPPPPHGPTYSRRIEELPHGQTVIEEQVVPTSHGYSSTVTKTTRLEFGNETNLQDALGSIDRYSSSRYDLPPSKIYENVGYNGASGPAETQRYSEHTILSGRMPGDNSDTGSSNDGGTLSPLNDGTVRYFYDERAKTHRAHVVSHGSSSEERNGSERDTGIYAFGSLPPLRPPATGVPQRPQSLQERGNTAPRVMKETCIDDIPVVATTNKSRETVIGITGVEHIGGHDTEVVLRQDEVSPSFQRDSQSRTSKHRLFEQSATPTIAGITQQQQEMTTTATMTQGGTRASLANFETEQLQSAEQMAATSGTQQFQQTSGGVTAYEDRLSQQYSMVQKPPVIPPHGSRYENLTMSGMQQEDGIDVQMRETLGRSTGRNGFPGAAADAAVEAEMRRREEILRQTTHDVQRDSYVERNAPTVHRVKPVPTPRSGSQPSSPPGTMTVQMEEQNIVMIPSEMRQANSPIQYRIQMGQKSSSQQETVKKWGPEIPPYHERYPDPTQAQGYQARHIAQSEETDTDGWDTDDSRQRGGQMMTTTTVTQVRTEHQGTGVNGDMQDRRQRPPYLEGPLRPSEHLGPTNDPRSPMKGDYERHYPSTPGPIGSRDEQSYRLLEEQRQPRAQDSRNRKVVEKRIRNRTSYFGPEYPHWKMKYFLAVCIPISIAIILICILSYMLFTL